MAKPTYDSFVQSELKAAFESFKNGHGHDPNIHDIAHFAWERMGGIGHDAIREYDNWIEAAYYKDTGTDVPWVTEPETGTPPPTNGDHPSHPSYRPNILDGIRGAWSTGPFIGITEAPGRPDWMQDWYLDEAVRLGITDLPICIVNGSTHWASGEESHPSWPAPVDQWSKYDGFREQFDMLANFLRKCAARKIIPWLTYFQGEHSDPNGSWGMMNRTDIYYNNEEYGYCNYWARDNEFREWLRRIDEVMAGGLWGILMGFEIDKKFESIDGNDASRGPGEKIGWNGLSSYWAKTIKETVPHVPVIAHFLPDVVGPESGDGGRDWTPEGYWKNGHTCTDDNQNHLDCLGGQYQIDEDWTDETKQYMADQTDEFMYVMATANPPRVFCALETVRPWASTERTQESAEIVKGQGCNNVMQCV